MLADAIAKLESTLAAELEQRTAVRSSTEAALDDLRTSVSSHGGDLSRAVEEMARMCALLAEHVESERAERRALVEAVRLLANQAIESANSKPRVLGGSMYASPAVPPDGEIVLVDDDDGTAAVAPARLAIGAAVRCRFGDGWIDGLEVCEAIAEGGTVRYRLRRAADQYVLPARFERRDLELAEESPGFPNSEGRWSRS
jgi:hypothetical protein